MSRGTPKYTEHVQVAVEPEVRAWVKAQAEKLFMNESAFMRMLIAKYRSTTKPKTGDC